MTTADFKSSLSGAAPCAKRFAAARRAVVGRQRRLDQGARDRAGRRGRGRRVGSCLSAPGRRRSRQCRLLVPAGRQAGCERSGRGRMGSELCRRCFGTNKDECTGQTIETDQGRHRRLGNGDRPRGPCPGHLELKTVFRRLDRIRRRAQQPRLAGRCGDAGHAAGDQRRLRQAGGAHRPRPEGADQSALGVRPQELFLSRSAAGLSDQPVQTADRGRGRGGRRAGGRGDRYASASSGCIWSRMPASRCTTRIRPCRSSTSTAPASR